jgi:hypothetical protein
MPNWGQGAQGAAGGAAVGTAILPGWGTAIGAGVGGAIGLFSGGGGPKYDEVVRRRLLELEQQYGTRAAPQGTAAPDAQNSQFRTNQAALISQLEQMGRGNGPSAAQLMMREANDRAVAGQASAAAGAAGRGANAGAAYLNAANQSAGLTSQANRDAGLMRVNEQLGAINQLGMTIHGARGADEATARFNVGQQNAMTQANMQAYLQQLGLNDAAQLRALQQASGSMTGNAPGMGTQIMAGGASALGGMMNARGAGIAPAQVAATEAAQQGPAPLPTQWNFNPTPGYDPYGNQPVPSVTRTA